MKKQNFTPNIVLYRAFVLIGLLSLSSISLAQDSPWTTKSPMPTARFWFSCEVVNGKIYAIGGATAAGSPTLKTVEEYDPVTDTWTTKQDMPTARCNMASAVVEGKIYVVGGDRIFQVGVAAGEKMLEIYDPATDTWDVTKTDMPTAREGISGCVINDTIYVVGGVAPGAVFLNKVEAYDPATDTWTTKASMLTKRWAMSTVVVDGKMYAMGTGQGGNIVEEYDPATDTWTSKASMPVGSGYFGTVVVDGIIYTMGGGTSSSTIPNARMFAYDPVADEWSEKTTMPTGRFGLGTGFVNGKIYAIGGAPHYTMPPLSINEEYDPHFDLLALIENIELDRGYTNPGTDSVCITTKISDPAGITIMAHIEAPDHSPVDSLMLFDDGNHNDGNAGDGLYANVWQVSSPEEQQYYVDLKVTRIDTDTVIHQINNMASFTTIGPVVFENYTFTSSDTVPDPGDRIRMKLTLMNNGSVVTATNIAARLISLDPLVDIVTGSQNYGDIAAGSMIQCNNSYVFDIAGDHPVNSEIPFALEILSENYTFWRDTFSIMIEELVNNIDNITEPVTRIYPNPAGEQLTVEFTSIPEANTVIELMDISGKVVYSGMANVNSTNHAIDLRSYKEGLYLIRISNEKYTVTKKVIKY